MPTAGIPHRYDAATVAVPANPAIHAERAASSPASAPWARRKPKSTTWRPAAACTIRAALVATAVWNAVWFRSRLSAIWQTIRGPSTRISGSPANTTVPSGTASTSPVKVACRSASQVRAEQVPVRSRWASASSEKRRPVRYSTARSSPAASR